MRLANQIVWLSTDVSRRSRDLDESYLSLSKRIAERLEIVKTLLIAQVASGSYV